MNRIEYIDIMKGIAIILVVIGHYIGVPFIKTFIWSFHMPLFVFLSGYFFKPEKKKQVLNAAKSYLKPYCIVWFLLIIYETLTAPEGYASDVAVTRLISGLCGIGSNNTPFRPDYVIKIGAIWFLYALFVAFCYLKIVFKFHTIKYQVLAIITIIVIWSFISSYVFVPFGLNNGAGFLIWLYVGYCFNRHANLNVIQYVNSHKYICIICFFLFLALEYYNGFSYSITRLVYPLYGIEVLCALCGIVMVRCISQLIENIKKLGDISFFLQYVGRKSLWILCVHSFSIEHSLSFYPQKEFLGLIHGTSDVIIALVLCFIWDKFKSYKLKDIKI